MREVHGWDYDIVVADGEVEALQLRSCNAASCARIFKDDERNATQYQVRARLASAVARAAYQERLLISKEHAYERPARRTHR
jgi:hypothetical protein